MIRKTQIILPLCILFLFVSCSDDDNPVTTKQVEGSGNLITESRNLAPIIGISVSAPAVVEVTHGLTQRDSITADNNIMQYITTTIDNGILNIGIAPDVSLSNTNITIKLVMTDLKIVAVSGPGSVTGMNDFNVNLLNLTASSAGSISLDLLADNIVTLITGTGSVTLEGSTTRHSCTLGSVGSLHAFGLQTDTTNVALASIGNAEVNVNDLLEVILSGTGSVFYKGDPTINDNITGSGSIIDAN